MIVTIVVDKFFEDICDKKADFNNISSRVGYMCPIVVYI